MNEFANLWRCFRNNAARLTFLLMEASSPEYLMVIRYFFSKFSEAELMQ